MTAIRSVLFDLDGTLVDTAPDMVACLNQLFDQIGIPTVDYDYARSFISQGLEALLRTTIPRPIPDSEMSRLRKDYLEIYTANLNQRSKLFEQMENVLQTLEQRGLHWGVVTNKPGFLTDPLLKGLNLTERCCAIISADTTAEKKPHPLPLLEACRRCKVQPSTCVYVGDDSRDIEAGNAAGMRTIAVSWGYHSPEDAVYSWPATSLIHEPIELIQWLDKQRAEISD